MMSIGRWLVLGWMVAGLQVLSAAQNPAPQPDTPTQNSGDDSPRTVPAAPLSAIAGMQTEGGAEDTGGNLPQIPAVVGGSGISSTFEGSNYLRGGVNVGVAYDNNPLLLSNAATSITNVSIFPNIGIEESSSRMHWSLRYAGGLTINQGFSNQNQDSQNLNFDSQYRLSPHVNLRVAENFSMTTGFFDAGNGPEVVAGSGGPNASLLAPLSTQRSSVTTVEMNYHFALNDLIGASGSFYDLHFANVPAGTQLTDSETASGRAFWLHRLFGADWGGVDYGFDRLTFNPGGETRVHSFFAMDTLNISKRLTVNGYIGPQYTENQGLSPVNRRLTQSSNWSLAGGVQGGWKNQRTSVSAGYSRGISDGAGVLGSTLLETVQANFRRQLTPGWAATLSASHGTNQSITVPFASTANSVNLTSAGILVERNVGKSIGLRMGYSHDFQEQVPGSGQTLDAHRNEVFMTLSYKWAKPLGM